MIVNLLYDWKTAIFGLYTLATPLDPGTAPKPEYIAQSKPYLA